MGEVLIFESANNQIEVSVQFENETVWLNLSQIATLFDRDKSVISRHLNKIFKSNELEKNAVVAKNATTAADGKTYQVEYFNLDVILSVGYRVNSKRGTQFRIWANKVLKDYLVKGYVINEKRLAQKEQEVQVLKGGIQILSRAIKEKLDTNEWLSIYAKGLSLLDDYDHKQLDTNGLTVKEANYPSVKAYYEVINQMKSKFDSDLFGKEKDKNFQSSISQITKGMGKTDFYPSLEEKAAMLLYLIVKNHSFVDGNKRIAAACFLKFLHHNSMLFNKDKQPIINQNTLASLTLFIAASKPEEMITVKQLIISVLNRNE